jgi:hypothetical protein
MSVDQESEIGAVTRPRRGWRAFFSLALTLLGPVAYLLMADDRLARITGWPAFLVMGTGSAIAVVAALRDRRLRIMAIAASNVTMTIGFAVAMFYWAVLPTPTGLDVLAKAPDFVLEDHTGRTVSLSETLSKGPALLVFYRGDW